MSEGALGGEAVLAYIERRVPLITVANPSLLSVTAEELGLESPLLKPNGYAEAVGLVLTLRDGLSPISLSRPHRLCRSQDVSSVGFGEGQELFYL